jgi:hypothetical protein
MHKDISALPSMLSPSQ